MVEAGTRISSNSRRSGRSDFD